MLVCPECQATIRLGAKRCEACGVDASGAAEAVAIGIAGFERRHYEAALKQFERARQIEPDDPDIARCLAHALFHTEQSESARRKYRVLIEKDPHDIEAQYVFGRILVQLGHLDQARGFFESLVSSPVEIVADQFYLGLYFQDQDQFRADCYYFLAIICWNRSDVEAAEHYFGLALKCDGAHAAARRYLGNLHLQAKAYNEAVESYMRFLKLDHAKDASRDDVLEVQFNLGIAQFELGNTGLAMDLFKSVLKDRPDHPGAIYQMNEIYQREGMYRQSENIHGAPRIEVSEGASTIFGLSNRDTSSLGTASASASSGTPRPIIGKSMAMQRVLRHARLAAASDATVLITGENGTGKELIARVIYDNSLRLDKIFMPINCAAIPEALIESELFGHEMGAFTGAVDRKIGHFEAASTGTIFLDEIGELDFNMQVKLLRFLQEREFTRVGGTEIITVDVRIIAATNQNLDKLLLEKRFRQDLYYRLNVLPIHVPALRERPEDIPLLVNYFIHKYGKASVRHDLIINEDDMHVLMEYPWPGNIRELENVVERAAVLGTQVIPILESLTNEHRRKQASTPVERDRGDRSDEALPDPFRRLDQASPAATIPAWEPASIREIEKRHILQMLSYTEGNRKQAAQLLGINPATLWRKIKSYEISV